MPLFKFIMLCSLLALVTGCTSLPRIYSGESVHGWVIDSKTKQPIKDVVVVEIWELEGGFHSDHTANIHIAETLTDSDGYYFFPDWGPKFTVDGSMSESAPYLVYYKFGYDDATRINTISGNLNPDNSVSEHSGKKIELVKFNGTPKQYLKELSSFHSILKLSHYRSTFNCNWEKIPRFSAEMIYLESYFSKNRVMLNIGSGFPHIGLFGGNNCNDPNIVLKGYLYE